MTAKVRDLRGQIRVGALLALKTTELLDDLSPMTIAKQRAMIPVQRQTFLVGQSQRRQSQRDMMHRVGAEQSHGDGPHGEQPGNEHVRAAGEDLVDLSFERLEIVGGVDQIGLPLLDVADQFRGASADHFLDRLNLLALGTIDRMHLA